MRISDWSSDVCSSDLRGHRHPAVPRSPLPPHRAVTARRSGASGVSVEPPGPRRAARGVQRSEEHTSELQSLMRISYAVFCLKKKKIYHENEDFRQTTPSLTCQI